MVLGGGCPTSFLLVAVNHQTGSDIDGAGKPVISGEYDQTKRNHPKPDNWQESEKPQTNQQNSD